jgi:hypothetical protein
MEVEPIQWPTQPRPQDGGNSSEWKEHSSPTSRTPRS